MPKAGGKATKAEIKPTALPKGGKAPQAIQKGGKATAKKGSTR
jgi:hypothetical protein